MGWQLARRLRADAVKCNSSASLDQKMSQDRLRLRASALRLGPSPTGTDDFEDLQDISPGELMASKGPRKANGGFDLSQSPSHLLRRCVQYANDLFSREPGASDLTKQQFTVLAAVEQNEGMSQTDLVAITGIDRSTLAEMIRRMIDKGLLDRERTEADQRANAVRIAMAGRKALRGARTASDRVERALLASLNATDRARFLKMLSTVVSQAETDGSAGSEPRAKPRRGR
jgi:DNA-binding MarR family transcriptional regulator